MKKHDEGYVLPFVLVVTVVLCIVAVAILSSALDNLTAQQDSIAQMQDKYAAQGEIEKVVAGTLNVNGLSANDKFTGSNVVYRGTDAGYICMEVTHNRVTISCAVKKAGSVIDYKYYTVTVQEPTEPTETIPPTGGGSQ